MTANSSPLTELCSGTYRALRIPGRVILSATGFHNTSGYRVFLHESPLTVFPPEFSLWHVRPSGIVQNVIASFAVSTELSTNEKIQSVVVLDAQGKHTVTVEDAGPSLHRHAAASRDAGDSPKTESAEPEAVTIDPDWKSREGYDPKFIGSSEPISLPGLSEAMQKSTVEVPDKYRKNGQAYTLHYHHYSLSMNQNRRMAWFSAANIDGKHAIKIPRQHDRWFIDPRIEPDPTHPKFQLGEDLYSADKTDRGHLTRYLDVAWGKSEQEATNATSDTFHFTNCCLELSGFNQGKDRWQGLERFLLENKARKEERRMTVMTGPVFRQDDPPYQNPQMDSAVRIPLRFWKVCALIREDGSLASTGFILGQQDITNLPGFAEAFDVIAAQVTIAELERLTGLSFGVLTQKDHFAAGGHPGTIEAAGPSVLLGRIKLIRSPQDIVI